MAQTMHFVDGRFDLKQQQDQLNFIETVAFCEVLTYTKLAEPASTVNRAVFDDVALGAEHKDLELVAIGPAEDPGAVIAEKLTSGKNVVFHTRVFVEQAETVVVAFR